MEINNRKKPPYRVQEYILDTGVYQKRQILEGVSDEEYSKKNAYHNSFYVILPPDDKFGEKLPQTVLGENKRVRLIRSYEQDDIYIPIKCIDCGHHKIAECGVDYCEYIEYWRDNGIPVPYPYFFIDEYPCKGQREIGGI